jgi:hypothetical protein
VAGTTAPPSPAQTSTPYSLTRHIDVRVNHHYGPAGLQRRTFADRVFALFRFPPNMAEIGNRVGSLGCYPASRRWT